MCCCYQVHIISSALKFLSLFCLSRAFTAVEMRKKLNGKKFPSHVIEAVITDFQSR